jgi:hypothetical protein
VADDIIHIADGESHVRIVDPSAGTLQAPLKQISSQGALLDTRLQFEPEAALDLTVVLKGLSARQFFANVAFSDGAGLHIQWMPIDSGEQARLRSLLEAYKTLRPQSLNAPEPVAAQAGVREKGGTRRVIKPKSMAAESATAIVPFADSPSETGSESSGGDGKPTSERVRTRRVLRPSSQKLPRVESEPAAEGKSAAEIKPVAEAKPTGEAKPPPRRQSVDHTPHGHVTIFSEESGAQPVQVEPGTDSFPDDSPSGGTPISGKTAVIGQDGRMDIGASIRNRAKSIRASELAARHDRVRVLNMGTIKQLIQEAVEEASAHLTRALGEQDRKRLLEEAEENFKERLKMFEAEKLSAEMKAKQLQDQLRTAQDLLESERKRTIKADQFTVSAAGLDEIETKFKRLLDHSIAEGRVVPTLEEELRKVIATVFDAERARIREQELKAQNEKIQLLESKIKRLAGSLEESERQRDEMAEWAKMLEASGGGALRNVFEAGLKDGDPNKKRKLALMKEILDINRAMRSELGIATNPVDDETAEAIKKVEADSKLTPEEEAEMRERRKRVDEEPKPADKLMAAEMANVVKEAGGDVAENAVSDSDAEAELALPVKAGAGGATRVTADGTEAIGEGAEIDPDDMPWEPPAKTAVAADQGTVKKISVEADIKAPPLEKKKKK